MNAVAQPLVDDGLATAFRRAMRQTASSVHVITASSQGLRGGMTATAVCSLSLEPLSMLICVNRSASIFPMLVEADCFGINVLRRGQHAIAAQFGSTRETAARFTTGDWIDLEGVPALADAQASIACRKVNMLEAGTHTIFTGEVTAVRTADTVEPLLYLDGQFACLQGGAA